MFAGYPSYEPFQPSPNTQPSVVSRAAKSLRKEINAAKMSSKLMVYLGMTINYCVLFVLLLIQASISLAFAENADISVSTLEGLSIAMIIVPFVLLGLQIFFVIYFKHKMEIIDGKPEDAVEVVSVSGAA